MNAELCAFILYILFQMLLVFEVNQEYHLMMLIKFELEIYLYEAFFFVEHTYFFILLFSSC